MNLPIVLPSSIGRQREVKDVLRALRSSPLVTLTGAAGCGKTRLALRAAKEAGDHYGDGVYWVELARLTDGRFVLPAVARTLNVTESAGRSLEEGLLDALQDKRLLPPD